MHCARTWNNFPPKGHRSDYGSVALLWHYTSSEVRFLDLVFLQRCWWPRESVLLGSSAPNEFRTIKLTLKCCVKVNQRYICKSLLCTLQGLGILRKQQYTSPNSAPCKTTLCKDLLYLSFTYAWTWTHNTQTSMPLQYIYITSYFRVRGTIPCRR